MKKSWCFWNYLSIFCPSFSIIDFIEIIVSINRLVYLFKLSTSQIDRFFFCIRKEKIVSAVLIFEDCSRDVLAHLRSWARFTFAIWQLQVRERNDIISDISDCVTTNPASYSRMRQIVMISTKWSSIFQWPRKYTIWLFCKETIYLFQDTESFHLNVAKSGSPWIINRQRFAFLFLLPTSGYRRARGLTDSADSKAHTVLVWSSAPILSFFINWSGRNLYIKSINSKVMQWSIH